MEEVEREVGNKIREKREEKIRLGRMKEELTI